MEQKEPLLRLPAQLKIDEIEHFYEKGTVFRGLHDFCKQTIIDACATSDMHVMGEADVKIVEALEQKTG